MRILALLPCLAAIAISGCGDQNAPRTEASAPAATPAAAPAPVAKPIEAPAVAPVVAAAQVAAPAPVAAAVAVVAGAAELAPGLVGEYYQIDAAVEDFPTIPETTKPAVKKVDSQVNIESTEEGFNGTQLIDHFFVRWTGVVMVAKEGKYKFYTESDDGSRLFIDGTQVVDNNGLHAMEEKEGEIELKAGPHQLKLDFFENEVGAGCKLSWSGEGIDKAIIPASALFHKAGAEK